MMKPEPKLTHMPEHIKQKITDSVRNAGTILAISQMSKELQSLTKDSPTTLEKVVVEISVDKLVVILKARFFKPAPDCFEPRRDCVRKKLVMEFSPHKDGVLMRNTRSDWQKILQERDYRKAAVQYLLGTIGSKTLIKQFKMKVANALCDFNLPMEPGNDKYPAVYPKAKFEDDWKVILDEFERLIRGIKHQLLVKRLSLRVQVTESQLLQILPYFEPGTLTDINLLYAFPINYADRQSLNLAQLSETEQWKKLNIRIMDSRHWWRTL